MAHLEGYAGSFDAPVREGIDVSGIRSEGGGFVLETSDGDLSAQVVTLATGAYHRPHRPPAVEELPSDVALLDTAAYRNEASLPPGAVLIVGSGQSGCQLAEEMHGAGREVTLSCGRAPWGPRRVGGSVRPGDRVQELERAVHNARGATVADDVASSGTGVAAAQRLEDNAAMKGVIRRLVTRPSPP